MENPDNQELQELLSYNKCEDIHLFIKKKEKGDVSIYCDKAMKKILIDDYQIVEGTTSSLFMGSTTYVFRDLSEYIAPEDGGYVYVNVYTENQSSPNLKEIDEKYGIDGEETYTYLGESGYMPVFAAVLAAIILMLLTYYECLTESRQNFVMVTTGHRLGHLILKEIVIDLLLYLAVLAATAFIMSRITYIFFAKKALAAVFAVFLAADSCLHLSMLGLSVRKVLGSSFASVKILKINRVIFVIVTVAAVIVLGIAAGSIREISETKDKYDFFENKKDYCRVLINGSKSDFADEYILQYDAVLYSELYQSCDVIQMDNGGSFSGSSDDREIKINDKAVKYLKEFFPELSETDFDEEFYIIMPDHEEISEEKMDEWKRELYSGTGKTGEPEIIKYSGERKFPAIDGEHIADMVYQPVILLSRNIMQFDDVTQAPEVYNSLQGCLVNASEKQLEELAEKYDLQLQAESPWNSLKEDAERTKLILKICVFASAIFLLTIVIILGTIIRLVYIVEGKELCVKRILGYSNSELMRPFYKMIVENCIAAFIILMGLKHNSLSEIAISVFCSLFVLAFSLCEAAVMGRIQERRSIVKILKGGAL